jgi:hypothetical protein
MKTSLELLQSCSSTLSYMPLQAPSQSINTNVARNKCFRVITHAKGAWRGNTRAVRKQEALSANILTSQESSVVSE